MFAIDVFHAHSNQGIRHRQQRQQTLHVPPCHQVSQRDGLWERVVMEFSVTTPDITQRMAENHTESTQD